MYNGRCCRRITLKLLPLHSYNGGCTFEFDTEHFIFNLNHPSTHYKPFITASMSSSNPIPDQTEIPSSPGPTNEATARVVQDDSESMGSTSESVPSLRPIHTLPSAALPLISENGTNNTPQVEQVLVDANQNQDRNRNIRAPRVEEGSEILEGESSTKTASTPIATRNNMPSAASASSPSAVPSSSIPPPPTIELTELGLRAPELVATADGPLMMGNARHVRSILEELMADIQTRTNMAAQAGLGNDPVELRTLGLRRHWMQRRIDICEWYITALERRSQQ